MKIKSFSDTPAGGSNVTSQKACQAVQENWGVSEKTFPLNLVTFHVGKKSFFLCGM